MMNSWIDEHPRHLIGFSERVIRLRPITREALMFGLAQEILTISPRGDLILGPNRIPRKSVLIDDSTPEVRECLERSRFVGRWLADAGTPATVLASWGIAL